MDWAFKPTSLMLFQWFKLEALHNYFFTAQITADFLRTFDVKKYFLFY